MRGPGEARKCQKVPKTALFEHFLAGSWQKCQKDPHLRLGLAGFDTFWPGARKCVSLAESTLKPPLKSGVFLDRKHHFSHPGRREKTISQP